MNARVLELLKNPEKIQSEDLKLLESEIKSKPYIQNIRALYLYGTHQFNIESYPKELSKTAAYTTDKKILYHFINKNAVDVTESNFTPESSIPQENSDQELETKTPENVEINNFKEPSFVEINGERNRILFEGEEEFLNENVSNDLQNSVNESPQENVTEELIEESSEPQEMVYEEEKIIEINNSDIEIDSVDSKIEIQNTEILEKLGSGDSLEENSGDLSFHGIETFMPNVAVPVENKINNYQPKQTPNRHEEEMKRLIAEVEAKIKAKKQSQPDDKKVVEDEPISFETNFAETQGFTLEKIEDLNVEESSEIVTEEHVEVAKPNEEIPEVKDLSAQKSQWKPMSLSSNTPDALIQKEEQIQEVQNKSDDLEQVELKSEKPEETVSKSEERPVFNVSFFAPNVSKIEEEKTVEPEISKVEEVKTQDSNIPQFINTWQNWLKIDRKEPEVSKEEIKEKAIEKFIENEPKISKLKEEINFVVKEKADDISHLMTETLAKLYVEQRLYSKAIKAYEALQQKHPEKADYFAEKISEVKDLRTNK